MFLPVLSESEKKLFYGIAYNLAISDGEFSSEEKEKMELYRQEMQIEYDETILTKPLDVIIREVSQHSSLKVKKIIMFEAIGMAMADNKLLDCEREIIAQMGSLFGFTKEFIDKCEVFIREYFLFQSKLNDLILK